MVGIKVANAWELALESALEHFRWPMDPQDLIAKFSNSCYIIIASLFNVAMGLSKTDQCQAPVNTAWVILKWSVGHPTSWVQSQVLSSYKSGSDLQGHFILICCYTYV